MTPKKLQLLEPRLSKLQSDLKHCYSADLCWNGMPQTWSPENPTYGTCAITSLIINDLYGGEIKKTKVDGITHYYNVIENTRVDLTAEQFADTKINYSDARTVSREDILSNHDTERRYNLLKSRLQNLYNQE